MLLNKELIDSTGNTARSEIHERPADEKSQHFFSSQIVLFFVVHSRHSLQLSPIYLMLLILIL
jgi:hypothetical protein